MINFPTEDIGTGIRRNGLFNADTITCPAWAVDAVIEPPLPLQIVERFLYYMCMPKKYRGRQGFIFLFISSFFRKAKRAKLCNEKVDFEFLGHNFQIFLKHLWINSDLLISNPCSLSALTQRRKWVKGFWIANRQCNAFVTSVNTRWIRRPDNGIRSFTWRWDKGRDAYSVCDKGLIEVLSEAWTSRWRATRNGPRPSR